MTSEILLDAARQVVERTVGLRLDPAQRYRLDYWLHHTAAQRGVADSELVDEIAAEGPALQSFCASSSRSRDWTADVRQV